MPIDTDVAARIFRRQNGAKVETFAKLDCKTVDEAQIIARLNVPFRPGVTCEISDKDGIWYTYTGNDKGYRMENHRV